MKKIILIDTGPLVAYLNKDDKYHEWALAHLAEVDCPVLTCEAVISEACFLLRKVSTGPNSILELIHRGLMMVKFDLNTEVTAVQLLMTRYKNVPMSLADACLVRMSELLRHASIMTLDSDFQIYRRHGRKSLVLISNAGEGRT